MGRSCDRCGQDLSSLSEYDVVAWDESPCLPLTYTHIDEGPCFKHLRNLLAAERARAERAEEDLLTVAQTLGYSYEADGHASKPAPVDVLVAGVRELQLCADRATDQAARLAAPASVATGAYERIWAVLGAGGICLTAETTLAAAREIADKYNGPNATAAQAIARVVEYVQAPALAALDGGE